MGHIQNAIRPFRVLIVGGSYGGLSAAVNLLDLSRGRNPRMASDAYSHHPDLKHVPVDITIVDERDGFLHLIGCPLAFASTTYASKTWNRFADIAALQRPNVHFIQGSVAGVDPATKSATVHAHVTRLPQTLSYDFLIVASGLRRPFPVVPTSLGRKQYLLEVEEHIHAVAHDSPDGVVVVGGGAVGIEMAAELKLVQPHVNVTLVHSRDKLLSAEGLSDATKDKALELTREAGVEVLLNHRVKETKKLHQPAAGSAPATPAGPRYEIEFENGTKRFASEVIFAVSRPVPSTKYLPAAAVDEEGYVKIQPSLFFGSADEQEQGDFPNADFHLCAGDAVRWSGIKRAGGAMYMGQVAACNAHQRMLAILTEERRGLALHDPVFKCIEAFPPVIGLAVGRKAVASGPDGDIVFGEDVMQAYFRDDLGFTICWDYMQLGKSPADELAAEAEADTAQAAAATQLTTDADVSKTAAAVAEIEIKA